MTNYTDEKVAYAAPGTHRQIMISDPSLLIPLTSVGQERPAVLRLRSNRNHIFKLQAEDIYYIRADRLKCFIVCKNKIIYVRHQMIQLEELVPEHFIRFHRSFILNPHHVLHIHEDCIEFEDHTRLIMSMNKCQWLERYLEEMRERQIDIDVKEELGIEAK